MHGEIWKQIASRAAERENYFTVRRPNVKLATLAADTHRCAKERDAGKHDARPTPTAILWADID